MRNKALEQSHSNALSHACHMATWPLHDWSTSAQRYSPPCLTTSPFAIPRHVSLATQPDRPLSATQRAYSHSAALLRFSVGCCCCCCCRRRSLRPLARRHSSPVAHARGGRSLQASIASEHSKSAVSDMRTSPSKHRQPSAKQSIAKRASPSKHPARHTARRASVSEHCQASAHNHTAMRASLSAPPRGATPSERR